MSSVCPQTSDRGRFTTVCWVVGLSLFVAAGAFALFAYYEISIGNLPNSYSDFYGDVKDGELWFGASKTTGNPLFPGFEFRINRLNLRTGVISETNLSAFNQRPVPIWVNDTLYVNTYGTFYEASGQTFTVLPPISPVGMTAFEFEGQLTVVVPTKNSLDERFLMMHWVNGQWKPGREILLPNPHNVWRHDPQTDRFNWSTSEADTSHRISWGQAGLFVARHGQQYHVMFRSPNYEFSAYRLGFEFADEAPEEVSALETEDLAHDTHGWEPVSRDLKNREWTQLVCDSKGPLFLSAYFGQRVVRRLADGHWSELTIDDHEQFKRHGVHLIATSSESESYAVLWDGLWSSAKICRIDERTIQSPDVIVPGYQRAYVERWVRILAELFCVWILHISILAFGIGRITRHSTTVPFEAGHRHIKLASLGQRVAATLIDAAMLYVLIWIAWLSWRFYFFGPRSIGKLPTYDDLSMSLRNLEQLLCTPAQRSSSFLTAFFHSPIGWIFFPLTPDTGFFGAMMAILVSLGCLNVYAEGRFGITPGKWLMKIRTRNPKLRPCGLARAILRNVVRAVDFPLGLTPIPAAISLMFSETRQRLGDRIADTIVVQVDSHPRSIELSEKAL